jgi:hypothetical protein
MSNNNKNANSSSTWQDEFPEYDWGNKDRSASGEQEFDTHPLDIDKSTSASATSSSQFDYSNDIASYGQYSKPVRPNIRTLKKEGDTIVKGSEVSLYNISPQNIAAYTLIRNPIFATSLFGMFGSYGALFHSLTARAPARNTWYWGM